MGTKIKIVVSSIWSLAKAILFIKKKDKTLKELEDFEQKFGGDFNETMDELDKVSKDKNKTK